VALLAGVADAGAATRSPVPEGGPVLAGDGVAWVAPSGGHPWVWAAAIGGRAVRRQQLPDAGYELRDAQMAGSPSRLAVMTTLGRASNGGADANNGDVARDILGGTPDGPLTSLSPRCGEGTLLQSIDASGDLVAYGSCRNTSDDAVVVDPVAGAASATTIPGAGNGVRIAGRYLAWLENYLPAGDLLYGHRYDVAVFDRTTGAVVYRIHASDTHGGVHSFDIQDDGTLVLSYVAVPRGGDTAVMRVAWASVAAPFLHEVPLHDAGSYEVAIANDTVAFERGSGSGSRDFADIGTSDLSGHERLVARNGQGVVGHRSFDFDGRRLAWWSYGCSAALINVASPSPGARTVPRARRGCPLTFKARPHVERPRTVAFRVDCFGFESCSVKHVTLTLRNRRGVVIARGHGRRARLTSRGLALLVARHRLRVRMSAVITDVVGRKEPRSAQVTLRLP
jgi:hypothetical protein